MEKRIFRVLMSTVLLVLLIVFIVGVVQGIFIRHSQARYREELEESGRTIADDYKRLTDESLRNLTAEKAAKAGRVFGECDNLIYAFRNMTLSVLSGGEGPGEGALSLPRGDAQKEKVSSYYAIPYGVDISDDKVRSDIHAFAEIAPAVESTIDPEAPVYGAVAVTMSGPVLLINSMENKAAKNMAMLNEWSEAYRKTLSEEGIADEIVLSILVPDIVTGEYCTIVGIPVFLDGKTWGFVAYLIRQSYFEELVRENLLDEHDVCFITDRTDIDAFISSEKDGPFATVLDVPDREEQVLGATEKEASQALLQAFEKNESGHVNTRLKNPIAGSNEMTFYYSSIESDDWMLVMGRSRAVTEKHAGVLSSTLADIISDSKEVAGKYFISTIAFFLLAIIAAAIAASNRSRIYANKLAAPIRTLTDKVEALRGDSLDFSWTRMGEEGDETEILAEAFGVMTGRIKEDIRHITEMTSERERIAAELSFASEIQAAMLPPLTEEFTDGNGFTLYASMRPAKAVGGDFYDFFMIDPDHLAFLIADVSDKGMGAALFMAISKSVIRACALSGGSAGEVLKSADAILSENNEKSMFVTVFFAVLEISTGKVAACNAGHDYPMVCFAGENGERTFRILQEKHSMPLAFGLSGSDYPELSWQLSEGDRIFLYTDGVNEAQGRSGEQFGMERMLDVLNANMEKDDRELLEAMRDAVGKFVGDDPQFDDMTMISLTYRKRG